MWFVPSVLNQLFQKARHVVRCETNLFPSVGAQVGTSPVSSLHFACFILLASFASVMAAPSETQMLIQELRLHRQQLEGTQATDIMLNDSVNKLIDILSKQTEKIADLNASIREVHTLPRGLLIDRALSQGTSEAAMPKTRPTAPADSSPSHSSASAEPAVKRAK